MKFSILLGGAAGQGINTAEQQLLNLMSLKGFYHHSYKDYMSRVRGGTNFTELTLSDQPIYTHQESLDIIVALTPEVISDQIERLTPEGLLICDVKHPLPDGLTQKVIQLDYSEILKSAENPKGISMIILGALAKALSFDGQDLEMLLNPKWPPAILEKNKQTASLAYEKSEAFTVLKSIDNSHTMTLSGNHAAALGALAAGISFYAAYPMAPSSSVMNYVSQYEKPLKILVEQVEDEIAAVNAVIGASATGVRAMTSTSGGGFSLMAEGIGLAAVAEVPLVVLNVQRPGPATGLATRTEQSDLNFVLNASQGEFPRIILSYRNVSDAFYQTFKAFNLADKYRVPVILLSDQYLADSSSTIPAFDLESLKVERFLQKEFDEDYIHYDLSTLVQDRACPGLSPIVVMNDSHEHDPHSHVTESAENRIAMNHRRMEKLELIEEEMEEPIFTGHPNPEYMLISWGSVTAMTEAAAHMLGEMNIPVAALSFGDLYPLPKKTLEHWKNKNIQWITVEGNYQGQLAQLIARETGHKIEDSILKFDGRQFTPEYIVEAFKELI